MNSQCQSCRSPFVLSVTSHPDICGNCVPLNRANIRDLSDSRVNPTLPRIKTPKKAKTPICQPESWGKLTGGSCLCAGCGEIFNSLAGFDAHRRGERDKCCVAPSEMRKTGMSINARGRWITQEWVGSHIGGK